MKNHSIGAHARSGSQSVGGGGPRATGELNNVTLSEALDYMLKTFRGLWVYENCPGDGKNDRIVVFMFYPTGQRPPAHPGQP